MLQRPPAAPCAPARVFLALYPCFTCSLCLLHPFYMFYTTCAGSAGWRSDCVFYRCLCSFALSYRNGNIFMYVFMKLQHHGRAVLVFSGEWEGTGGRREEAAGGGSPITLPGASPGAGVGGRGRGRGCSVLCSVQQHITDIPSWEGQRAPWCLLTAAVSGSKDRGSHGRGVPVSLVLSPSPVAPRGTGALPASYGALEGTAPREHPHGERGRATHG